MSELSDIENFLLPSFVQQLANNDVVLDLPEGEGSTLSVSLTKRGKSWVRYAKKVDRHFDFEVFVQKVLQLTVEELHKIEEAKLSSNNTSVQSEGGNDT